MSAPLPLDDPRWGELTHAFGPATDVPDLLQRFATDPTDMDVWGEFYDSVCHQSSVYPASYAAAAHVVEIAESVPVDRRALCWIFVGTVAEGGSLEKAPEYVRDAYVDALGRAAKGIPETLATETDETDCWYLLSAAAAVNGMSKVAFDIISCHEGEHDPACPRCNADVEITMTQLQAGLAAAVRCTACGEIGNLADCLVARAADDAD